MTNLCIWVTTLPNWCLFYLLRTHPQFIQLRILKNIIKSNTSTLYGKEHQFQDIKSFSDFQKQPITTYSDYEGYIEQIKHGDKAILTSQPVMLLQPTSGSTTGSKFIPYTHMFQQEFQRGLNTWICNVFFRFPSVLVGKQYWSLSPSTMFANQESSKIRIGFDDDTGYIDNFKKWFISRILCVPAMVSQISDSEAFEYITLLFLVKENNLRYISIWSPTFFTALLSKLNKYSAMLLNDIAKGTIHESISLELKLREKLLSHISPDAFRASQLSSIKLEEKHNWKKIWPQLAAISCWADGSASIFVDSLKQLFPSVIIEEKGILATEGIISLPLGDLKPLAYHSHYIEFQEILTKEVLPLWEIQEGQKYSVILTTSGGLYRYRLQDIVEVNGFVGDIPCIKFIGRESSCCDMVGEKLHEEHINFIFNKLITALSCKFVFQLVAPTLKERILSYTLFVELSSDQSYNLTQIQSFFEKELITNYHYDHARKMDQLAPLRIFSIAQGSGLQKFINYHQNKGQKLGDIKNVMLSRDLNWNNVFDGEFVNI